MQSKRYVGLNRYEYNYILRESLPEVKVVISELSARLQVASFN